MSATAPFKSVAWPSTLGVALARGFASGSVMAAAIAISDPPQAYASLGDLLVLVLSWTLLSLPLALTCHGIAWLSRSLGKLLGSDSFSFVGLVFNGIAAAFSVPGLIIVIGDPLIYLFNRLFPRVLRLADFTPLNFKVLIIVYRESDERADAEAL